MIDRVNRVMLLLFGLALCAAGVVAIAARQRALRLMQPSAIYRNMQVSVASRPALWWTVVIAVAVLLALLGLVYALRQLPVAGTRLGTILLRRHDLGATRLEPSAVSKVVAADFSRMDDVTGSRVRMRGFQPQPSFAVRLDVDQHADMDQVRAHADEALQRVSHTLGVDGVDADLRLRLRSEQHTSPAPAPRAE
ncbi:MAG: hypothetical protein ACRDZO_14435 [Egibacteraceae bacterium]